MAAVLILVLGISACTQGDTDDPTGTPAAEAATATVPNAAVEPKAAKLLTESPVVTEAPAADSIPTAADVLTTQEVGLSQEENIYRLSNLIDHEIYDMDPCDIHLEL